MDAVTSARDGQIVQMLLLAVVAVFVGIRFVPSRHRQRVGIVLTVCYLAGIVGFVVYLLAR